MKKLISTMLVLSLILTLVPVTAKAENPFVQTDYTADPAPMVYNDVLYVYSSHDEDEIIDNFYTMFNWKCFSTTDMVNWTHHGTIANNKTFRSEERRVGKEC